jgi:hypothetical protein
LSFTLSWEGLFNVAFAFERDEMNKRSLLSGLLVIMVAMVGEFARAQQSPDERPKQHVSMITASDLTEPVLKAIQDIEERTVTIAEDFPDDLYNTYRPKGDPDVRTAAEILLHIAEQNESAASLIRTKPQEEALIASGKKRAAKDILTYVSKPDTVTKVKASFVAVRKAIEGNPDPKKLEWWIYVIAHSNGHFGNLVTYYRENGLVPPSSRQ